MSKTVVVGAFAHETNTFVPDAVTRADFQAREEHLYDEVPENMRGSETAVGGVIDVADQEEINLTKIESRPAKRGRSFQYWFFIDFEGHYHDEKVQQVLSGYKKQIKWLGSYVRLV